MGKNQTENLPEGLGKSRFAEMNSRNIYERVTGQRALFLCIDALDFVSKSTGEPSPRLRVRCCNYDDHRPSGQKITDEVDAYIPIGKFLVLANDVLTGTLSKKKQFAQKDASSAKHASYFDHFGGAYAPDVVSVRFSVVNGMDDKTSAFAFLATSGPGEIGKNGGIAPKKNSSPTKSIFINMPNDELKEFCLIGKAYIEQFIALDLQSRLASVRKMREAYALSQREGN